MDLTLYYSLHFVQGKPKQLLKIMTSNPAKSGMRSHRTKLKNIFMVMNITAIILFAAAMQVNAKGYSQITLSEKDAPLEKVFKSIERQSGYVFFFDYALLKQAKKVSVQTKGASLTDALDLCFKEQLLTYTIVGKTIVVKAKPTVAFQPTVTTPSINLPPPPIDVRGKVTNENGEPLESVTVTVKGTSKATATNTNGIFLLRNVDENATLVFTGVNVESYEVRVNGKTELAVNMKTKVTALGDVTVTVNTGYQEIPKERATGSFVHVDNELLNRRVSTDILSRLEDVTSGLVFNRVGDNPISIRGQSTIYANASPLIVLDNFPYDGDINSLNPNDVESITVLKDAAAASIWGARAGNGVIVITTKGGRYQSPIQIDFNSNITLSAKPDLFYVPQMSVEDYIETEKKLFASGYYNSTETSVNKLPLSPVIELLVKKRDGRIGAQEADSRIEDLKNYNLRNDQLNYLYRQSQNQQYALNIRGGGTTNRYFVSAGYDKNLASAVGQDYSRITLNGNNTFSFGRLELNTGIYLTQKISHNNNPGVLRMSSSSILYPYARLANDQGAPLDVTRDYRVSFINDAASKGLLDWGYNPLEELSLLDNSSQVDDYRLNAALKYRVVNGFDTEASIQYTRSTGSSREHHAIGTFAARDMINRFTVVNTNGSLLRPVPLGGMLDQQNSSSNSLTLRAMVRYNRTFNESRHRVSALAGWESRNVNSASTRHRLYGYDDEHATSSSVDYISQFKRYFNPASTQTIPSIDFQSALMDRFISYYANGAYTLQNLYTISGSFRLDQSNLFGVRSNQKGVPLWSGGLAWTMSGEDFYNFNWLPYLKIRASYGHNGNIDKSLSALTTARYSSSLAAQTSLPFASIQNPPNPELRWERVKILNVGIDFAIARNRLSGSVEIYSKEGIDLIGDTRFPPSSGIFNFRGNTANTRGSGVDLSLSTLNIDRALRWNTDFLFSYSKEEVSNYLVKASAANYLQFGVAGRMPLEGKPLYAVFSYPWNGLEPTTGNPLGFLEGVSSMDYSRIISSTTPDNVQFNGSSRPLVFGAFRNSVSFKKVTASVNLSYRLGYYFRRNSVFYGNFMGLGTHGDYARRWRQPGDERFTQIPSIPLSGNTSRDNFYAYSETLVEKGDHIRIQDLNFSYDLSGLHISKWSFRQSQLYIYTNNLGLLWKANKAGIDPDYQSGPPPFSLSAGLRIGL